MKKALSLSPEVSQLLVPQGPVVQIMMNLKSTEITHSLFEWSGADLQVFPCETSPFLCGDSMIEDL